MGIANRYERALGLQDAVNPRGVARRLVEMIDEVAQESPMMVLEDAGRIGEDPAVLLMVDKLIDLLGLRDAYGYPDLEYLRALEEAEALAKR